MNPGSPKAIAAGCLCACDMNNNGRGLFYSGDLKMNFWINDKCPIHGQKVETKA
jgi:hypothetical protein